MEDVDINTNISIGVLKTIKFLIEIMYRLMLEHYWKPSSTGRPFRPIMGLLSDGHPRE